MNKDIIYDWILYSKETVYDGGTGEYDRKPTKKEILESEKRLDKFFGNFIKAQTPPTAEEVCEALSKYLGEKVIYENLAFYGYRNEYLVCQMISKNKEIEFGTLLPQHLITMIGQFYEGLQKTGQ